MRYQKTKTTTLLKIIALVLIPALLIGAIPTPPQQQASAYTQADIDELQRQIDALRAREDELAAKAAEIAAETAGFEREKSRVENEIAIMQNNILLLEAEIEQLENEISTNQRKIENTELAISQTLVDMYMMEDITIIERIASSKSFSSFVDDSTSQAASTDSLATAVESIKLIKADLEKQQAEVEDKRASVESQKAASEARRAELQRAINGNHAEQTAYANEKAATIEQRKRLSARQSEIMWALRPPDTGGTFSRDKGGYPYQNDCPGRIDDYTDAYTMYVCECTSYAAFKVYQRYGIKNIRAIDGKDYWVSYDARNWDDNLAGIVPMGKTPRAGAVAVWDGGVYGHVAWVESVSGGNVWVSEYNYKYGDYYERNAAKTGGTFSAANATYIYFDEY